MKRFFYLILASVVFIPAAFAQSWGSDHINVGVYGNLFRIGDSQTDLAGVGARISVNIRPKIQLEAESSYNFAQAYSQGFSDFNGTVNVSRTQIRTLDGLFGPKFYTNKGPVRFFGTVKGGFMNTNLETNFPVTFGAVNSTFQNMTGVNTHAVFYPGGGAEAFWGPFGLRVDVGDEMFFNNGAHNNLRVSFGPTIRF